MRTVKNKTPIVDFLKEYAESDTSRLHMPGHKGKAPECLPEGLQEAYRYDITEISDADNLYDPQGIIKESEENASEIFGVKTFYSTEGSSLVIKTMLNLVCEEKSYIIAIGACHKAFYHAAKLMNVEVEKIASKEVNSLLRSVIALKKTPPVGVYITYPDYFGNVYDLKNIKDVIMQISDEFGFKSQIPLLVDGAHCAYFRFLDNERYPEYVHPSEIADICCTSAHKTLPTLTGAAYLHISENFSHMYPKVKPAMDIFGSSSPSYLIMASLDAFNAEADKFREDLKVFCEKADDLKSALSEMGFMVNTSEPLRITVFADEKYSGADFEEALKTHGCEAECFDDEYVILMLTPYNTDEDLKRIKEAFTDLKDGKIIKNGSKSTSKYNCLRNFS